MHSFATILPLLICSARCRKNDDLKQTDKSSEIASQSLRTSYDPLLELNQADYGRRATPSMDIIAAFLLTYGSALGRQSTRGRQSFRDRFPVANTLVSRRGRRQLLMQGPETLTDDKVDDAQANEREEIFADDPIVLELEERCREINALNGWDDELGMDQLLNPATVINIELDLRELRKELNASSDQKSREQLQTKIAAKEEKQQLEMRGIMRDWLKQLFVLTAVGGTVISAFLANDIVPFTSDPIARTLANVYGFWSIWIFTIPTLRARKPGGFWGMNRKEKRALDIALVLDFFLNILAPFATKDTSAIFAANIVLLGVCYAIGYLTPEDGALFRSLPEPVKWVLFALDPGAGKERGMKQEKREAYYKKLEEDKQNS